MTSRERVEAALAFEPVDKAPLEYHPCGRGLYEHGEAFRGLLKAHPGDFEDFSDMPIPRPPAEACGPDGSYHEYKTDAWGVTWESRIFAMTGHPYRQPLADWRALEGFRCPQSASPACVKRGMQKTDGSAFLNGCMHCVRLKTC